MTSSHRIILNTLATYGRTVFAMALGLFSSRWVLQSLGSVDYGLMAIVGGLILFVTFLNGIMAGSCSRFFALSVGSGDSIETNKWFNTALSIHTVLPAILILAGWPAGEWAIGEFLNIPLERLVTARWVFRFSLISAFCGMCSAPYMAMYIAKQNIAELSLWGIANTITNFCFVYWLTTYKGDAWLVYAGWTVGISILFGTGQAFRAHLIFPECRVSFPRWYERKRLRQVFIFSGWQLFGGVGAILRNQGIAILLNKYFSPVTFPQVNASYSIGNAVSGYTQTLSNAFLGALAPEITACEGRGDRQRMLHQSNRASKFGTYLVILLAIPVFLEGDVLLQLWLKTTPTYARTFCVFTLSYFLIDNLTYGQMIAVSARGKIAGYQMMLGAFIILTLPLAWLFLALGYNPTSVGWAFIITTGLLSSGRVIWAKYLVGASPRNWVKSVLIPCLTVVLLGLALGKGSMLLASRLGVPAGFLRLCLTTTTTTLSSLLLGWVVIMDETERRFVLTHLQKIKSRLIG